MLHRLFYFSSLYIFKCLNFHVVKSIVRHYLKSNVIEVQRIITHSTQDKLERLKAKSQALDEMIDSGILTDYSSYKDEIEKELEKIAIQDSVEDELGKLKGQIDLKKKRKKQTIEEQENGGAEDEQKEEQEICV
jgi:hypothetical protein